MSDPLEVRLLGQVAIRQNDTLITGFRSRKALALLIYLIYTGRSHLRETLADLLWEARSTKQSLSNLRTVLAQLRAQLAEFLVVTRQTLAFNQEKRYWLDIAELETRLTATGTAPQLSAVGAAHLAEGLNLYQGDFLADFHLPDAPRFNEWVIIEQERLRRVALNGFQRLVGYYLDQGDYLAGIKTASRWLTLDALDETAHRLMMQLLASDGQRAAALAQYTTCLRLLQDELGVDPDPATINLYDQIRAGEFDPISLLKPLRSQPLTHNLPAKATNLIGRSREIADICTLLKKDSIRLVTLTGPGGSGKTRLAIETARELIAEFEHGVWFVALAELTEGSQVSAAISQALHLEPSPLEQLLTTLKSHLYDKTILLVLDNFEHLLDKPMALETVEALLTGVARLKILVTSRVVLNLYGENEYSTLPLSLPDLTMLPVEPTRLGQFTAVQLFVERAQNVYPDFALTPQNGPVVAEICTRLDGLPLAIELAAARIRLFDPAALLTELTKQGLELLTSRIYNRTARQQTLRHTLDWSYALLSQEEQDSLARLGIFAGSFTLDAARAVLRHEPEDVSQLSWGKVERSVLEIITALLQHSLLQPVTNARGQARMNMLETIRMYALEKLTEQGELVTIQKKYESYYQALALAATTEAGPVHPEKSSWLEQMEYDYKNFLVTLPDHKKERLETDSDSPAKQSRPNALGEALLPFHKRGGPTAIQRIEGAITINRSSQAVFDVLSNPENIPLYTMGVSEVVVTTPESIGEGTTFRWTMQAFGRKLEGTGIVTTVEPVSRIGLELMLGSTTGRWLYIITPVGQQGVQLSVTLEAVNTYRVFKLVNPIFQALAQKTIGAMLRNLKRNLETSHLI